MKLKIFSVFSAAVLVLALGSPAKADTCATGDTSSSCSIALTVTNGFGSSGPTYGTVTLSLNGNGTITVDMSTVSSDYGLHQADFGFNTTDNGTLSLSLNSYTIDTGAPGAPTAVTSQMEDGFGTFAYGYHGGTGSSSNYSDLNFTVSTSTVGGFTSIGELISGSSGGNGSPNNWFAAQIANIPTGCTGFVGNAGSSNLGSTANCLDGGTPVPEPGSLALFGTGLLSLAGFLKRKLLA